MKNVEGILKYKVELDRFEGDKAVLFGEDNTEIILPKKLLPKEAAEGETLILTLTTEKAETAKREKTAKEILNEILNSNGQRTI